MSKHPLKDWIFATRPWSLTASAMPIIVTLTYLLWKGAEINWFYGVWTVLNMVLFHVGGNLWSDYNDFKHEVDREDTQGATSITSGMFTAKEIKNFALSTLIISIVSGLILVGLTGLPLLWIGLAGAAFTLLYPAFKYNALGDIDILFTFALLPAIGTSFIATGDIDWTTLLIVLPVGLITVAILHSNNTRDMQHDARANIKTMAMKLGAKTSAFLYACEVILPFILVAAYSVLGITPIYSLIVLLALPLALQNSKFIKQAITSKEFGSIDENTAKLQMLFSLILTIVFIVTSFIG